jgi:hypothetical protein
VAAYTVRTVYEVVTKGAVQSVAALHGSMDHLGGVMDRTRDALSTLVNPLLLAGAGAGLAAMAHGLVEMHSAAEDTSAILSGMFETFGITRDFNAGLDLARTTLEEINAQAAALPGEAEDYTRTFQAGFANFQQKFGQDVQGALAFSNQMTAVASALRVPAEEIATDVARLTQAGQGGAGARINTWARLLPYINAYRTEQHQAELDAHSFNQMTAQARIELLQNTIAMGGLRDVIDSAKHSWGAMEGGFKSALLLIARQASAPLFEGAKDALGSINDALMDVNGHLTPFSQHVIDIGTTISDRIVGAIREAVDQVGSLHDRFQQLGAWVRDQPWFSGLHDLRQAAHSAVADVGQNHEARGGMMGGVATIALGSLLGPLSVLAGPLLSLASSTGGLSVAFDTVLYTLSSFAPLLEPVLSLFAGINDILGQALGMVLPVVVELLQELIPPILQLGETVLGIVQGALHALGPSLMNLVRSLGQVLAPAIQLVAEVLQLLWDVAEPLVMLVGLVVDAFSGLLSILGLLLGDLHDRQQELHTPPQTPEQARLIERNQAVAVWDVQTWMQAGGQGASPYTADQLVHQFHLGESDATVEFLRRQEALNASNDAFAPEFARTNPQTPTRRTPVPAGHTTNNITIHQTVNEAEDPDRLLVMTRDVVNDALRHPIESPGARVTR